MLEYIPMARASRIIVPIIPHHITQRGNYNDSTFHKEEDYLAYCKIFNYYAIKYSLKILAFCLMSNHVHFICIPPTRESLIKTMGTAQMLYSQYFNKKRKMKGHLWQSRYYSCALDQAHLFRAVRYVERNPVRAEICSYPGNYQWSSAKAHLKKEKSLIYLDNIQDIININWTDYLLGFDTEFNNDLRKRTLHDLALGSQRFTRLLEKRFNRSLKLPKLKRTKR